MVFCCEKKYLIIYGFNLQLVMQVVRLVLRYQFGTCIITKKEQFLSGSVLYSFHFTVNKGYFHFQQRSFSKNLFVLYWLAERRRLDYYQFQVERLTQVKSLHLAITYILRQASLSSY